MYKKGITLGIVIFVLINLVLGFYWSCEPEQFEVKQSNASSHNVTGYTTIATLVKIANTLLDKPGGYLSNDITPPSIFLDNIANWEYGALIQIRDFTAALRKHISRSQSQSLEDSDLVEADPSFHFDSTRWAFASAESQYRNAIESLMSYQARLVDSSERNAQFFARADNLRAWLGDVEKRLGSLSQRLTASVGQKRINTDLAGESAAEQSTYTPAEQVTKTPWLEIDDVFYQARGATWALIHLLRAVEVDFASVLEKKNALISLKQIVRELEAAQTNIWSPVILNGTGFGFVANHSLVMASYISRANAAIIDLRSLLSQG